MRRLVPVAASVLAACSVALEGAPCATDANCPDSQRCDLASGRCVTCVVDPACPGDGSICAGTGSVRACRTNVAGCRYADVTPCQAPLVCGGTFPAASCRCPAADAVLGMGCSPVGSQTCDRVSANILTCATQGTCSVWQAAAGPSCTSQQLVCREVVAGSPACACAANPGPELLADAAQGSPSGAAPYPTGLATPPQCRYQKLGDALAAASAGSTVKMTGYSTSEVKFASEALPLVVKAGVTLATADASPTPAHYVIEVDQAGPSRPVLQLDHDASASGFTVRPGAGGTASEALLVSCGAAGTAPVALSTLTLDGKGALAASAIGDALHLKGPCGVAASNLLVENATGAGIRVETSFPLGGTAPAVSIGSSTIRGNGDSGLVVNVDASNGKPALHVAGVDITLNGATTPYTDAGVIRRGGGVVLLAATPALEFTGNRVHGNAYDQILVFSSNPGWTLSGSACDATSNVLTCYDATTSGGPYFGLAVLGGATVTASYDSWSHAVPAAGTDYYKTSASTVITGISCAASTLTCP